MPGDTPIKIPVADPIEPIDGRLLLHVPPAEGLDNVAVDPTHTEVGPTIPAIEGTTVTTIVTAHPFTL